MRSCKGQQLATLIGLLTTSQLAGQPVPSTAPFIDSVVVDRHFTTRTVNDKALVSTGFRADLQALSTIRGTLPQGFSPNTDPQQVRIGLAYQQPRAWIYLSLVNPTPWFRNLILEVDHNRCDTLDAFLVDGRRSDPRHLGTLFRHLPLMQRAIPVREFALPFTLRPYERSGLLLFSRRTTGNHELSINIATQKQFVIGRDRDAWLRLGALWSVFFFSFMVLSLGLLFRHRLLLYFGVYTLSSSLGPLNFNYFFDAFPFPPGLGLTANSVGLFSLFIVNALLHPFGLAYTKNLPRCRDSIRYTSWLLVGANLMQCLLLLVPLSAFRNELVTHAALLLTTLNIGWLFYIALLAFYQKKETYLLLTASLVFVPVLYKTYIQPTPGLNTSYVQPFFYLVAFGYLTICLLRRELSSRQLTQQTIRLVELKLEQLRQTEIEQIGRDLHDQLGNTLASALGYLSLQAPRVGLAQALILKAIQQIRLISHNLVKDDGRDLSEKLNDLAERFTDFSPIHYSYQDFTEGKLNQLSPLKRQSIYLIVQEVLNNSLKHSQAREVTIQAFFSEDLVRVSIEDDGIGYQVDAPSRGIGVSNMHKRASLAGLRILIDSGLAGTSVSIETSLVD